MLCYIQEKHLVTEGNCAVAVNSENSCQNPNRYNLVLLGNIAVLAHGSEEYERNNSWC